MSFPYPGTIPSDMCSSTQVDTHITSDSVLLRRKHISICDVSSPTQEQISLVICVSLYMGTTYP